MKRLFLLCLTIVALNSISFSQSATAPAGGGTEADPYMITNLENLYWISANQSAWSSFFIQSADIDAAVTQTWNSGEGWGPIGNSSIKFTGSYNGKGYSITNLHINKEYKSEQGLFGYTSGAAIDSVRIVNSNIKAYYRVGGLIGYSIATNIFDCHSSGTVTGDGSVGGLTGRNENSVITHCSSAGSVSGRDEIGGLTGKNTSSVISNCYSSCSVTANYQYAGGLIGANYNSNVSACFANGPVYAKNNYAGGLAGYHGGSGYVISDCYSTGMVTAGRYAGGLIGSLWQGTIRNCYANGMVTAPLSAGGLTGHDFFSTIENSFWDTESTGQSSNKAGTGKSTTEMKSINTFTDLSTVGLSVAWDFTGNPNNDLLNEDIWRLNTRFNMSYPSLSFYQIPESPEIYTTSSDILSTSATIEGVLMSLGNSDVINYGACWNTTGSPDLNDNTSAHGQLSSSQPVSVSVSGLEPQTTYHVRLYATNSEGTGYSTEFTIRTHPIEPVAPSGEGSPDNPYLIGSLNNLFWIGLKMNEWDKNYVQTAPINASVTQNWNSGEGWIPIANDIDRFTGSYNGKEYPIDSLFIHSGNNYSGLFGYVDGAQLDSIQLTNISLRGTYFCGGLTGYARNSSVNSCYVNGTIEGKGIMGGITGQAVNTKIQHATSDCHLSGEIKIGGITGQADANSLIDSCLSKGSVKGEQYIGGLAGLCYAPISNSYTKMTALKGTNSDDTYFGGLAGACYGPVTNSYYNYDSTLIRSTNHHTIGVLYDAMFKEWIGNDMQIDIDQHMKKSDDHYLINSVEDLQLLLAFGQDSSLKFRLGADIDMIGLNEFFIPYFSGALDGNGHTIKNFRLYRDAGFRYLQSMGLIGRALYARVTNLKMDRFFLYGGKNFVGGLAGVASESHFSGIALTNGRIIGGGSSVGGMIGNTYETEIIYCSFKGSCIGWDSFIGGLVGTHNNSYTGYSFADAEVSGGISTGGLVGSSLNNSVIEYSYATGIIKAAIVVGGFAGSNRGSLIRNSYARANVTGTSSSGLANKAGGFVGENFEEAEISGSYATGYLSATNRLNDGGFCGSNNPGDWEFGPSFITGSYWDMESSGKDYSNGGAGFSTAQMKNFNSFPGWIFATNPYLFDGQENIWVVDSISNNGYPFLSWQTFPPVILSEATDITDTSALCHGTVTYWRNPLPLQYGLCWNTTGEPTINDAFLTGEQINGTSAFNLQVSSFEANTEYFIRGYVTHASGTTYSNELSITTLPIKPVMPVGDGSTGDPYQIETLMNLYWLTVNDESWDKHFIQVADINAAQTARWHGGGWLPICSKEYEFPPFTGTYHGKGHSIDSLWINREHYGNVGLFGIILGASIDSLSVTNVLIDSKYSNIGALAGKASNSTVNHCSSSGSITGRFSAGGLIGKSLGSTIGYSFSTANVQVDALTEEFTKMNFGGLIGSAEQGSVIEWSYSTGNVAGDINTGGLTGANGNNSLITDCFSTGNVTGRSHTGGLSGMNYHAVAENSYSTGTVTGVEYTGGLAGRNSNSQITNCYSRSAVSGTTYTGGFTGMNDRGQIDKCYSAGTIEGDDAAGGLTSDPGSMVLSSFWDKDLAGISAEGDARAKSTEEMTRLETYTLLATVGLGVSWDFQGTSNNDLGSEDLWHMDTALHSGYPFFNWQQFFAVSSTGVTNITETTATISGSLNMWNYSNVLDHGLCWNTSGNPDTTDERSQEGTLEESAAFQADLTGLSPETTYYFRAYAVNDTGTVYGEVLSFTTLTDTPPVLTGENAISKLKIYPNPAREKVEVMYTDQAGGTWRVDLYTLQGTKILSRDITGERTNLELGDLPPSVYLLKITDSEGKVATVRLATQD